MNVLTTENLTKKYGFKNVVENVNMTIEKGDIYGFVGKNGAGKTTLMRMVLTLCRPTSGKVTLFEQDNLLEGCKRVGSLIETPCLYKSITAYETLKRYSILYGSNLSQINEILDYVGLKDAGKKKVGSFSLGMKQRLGIAVALLGFPEFMVLDEPVNGLDPVGMKEIRDIILRLNKERGITFLISSHLLDELAKTANKIGIINEGHLIEQISMNEMNEKCKAKILYTVDNSEKAAELLKNKYTDIEMYVNENTISVVGMNDETAKINSYLVNNSIEVSGIENVTKSLEQYYIEKVGGSVE